MEINKKKKNVNFGKDKIILSIDRRKKHVIKHYGYTWAKYRTICIRSRRLYYGDPGCSMIEIGKIYGVGKTSAKTFIKDGLKFLTGKL